MGRGWSGAENLLLLRIEFRLRQGTGVEELLELHQVAVGVRSLRCGRGLIWDGRRLCGGRVRGWAASALAWPRLDATL